MVDAKGCYVVPGGVDSHAHIDEFWKPEQNGFENRDSFFSAGTAAACGGLTPIICQRYCSWHVVK